MNCISASSTAIFSVIRGKFCHRLYATSSLVEGVVFSPAVNHLLLRHGISAETATSSIQATGPKGRLLKGDVLAYISNPSASNSYVSSLSSITHGYYSADFNVTPLVNWAKSKYPAATLNDCLALVFARVAQAVPELKSKSVYIARLSSTGLTTGFIDIPETSSSVSSTKWIGVDRIASRLKPSDSYIPTVPTTLRLYDQSMSSLKTLFPHITPASNTSAIATISHISTKSASTITASPSLSFWQPPSQVKSQLDILDSLTSGASTSSGSFIRTAATVSSSDIDDLLNLSQSSSSSSPSSETWVRVDLTVDSSKIPHSVVVNKVWKIWKEIIEEPSTSLSK